ncbi:2-aminoethanethiol (cysteamine) dioxygenase b [Entelurus aequoreus]|uniref:2-aminoethanethiol (cysteamine) dioxygenase b n=1 Tax=Entelurus aequoreus TaxID=161455 RepID=UPI002B1DE176|nr:2-aminoethanethiol (cysteamine) dioxygenase b [Entelurus aequoreus]
MRPREDAMMTSIVQRIARQALVTFRSLPGLGAQAAKCFAENHDKLHGLMSEVRAADLKLAPPAAPPPRGAPPVTYMHICETEHFSMGVFLLKSGACIPLHDHPGMHGLLRVMYGKVRISCYDRLESSSPPPGGALRRCLPRSRGEYTQDSEPCLLAPERDNLHQIDAVDGPAAFVDILAPPYDPDDGRDCHYYRVLPEAELGDPQSREVWLMEISQPVSFWCGTEPYPGPEVRL